MSTSPNAPTSRSPRMSIRPALVDRRIWDLLLPEPQRGLGGVSCWEPGEAAGADVIVNQSSWRISGFRCHRGEQVAESVGSGDRQDRQPARLVLGAVHRTGSRVDRDGVHGGVGGHGGDDLRGVASRTVMVRFWRSAV